MNNSLERYLSSAEGRKCCTQIAHKRLTNLKKYVFEHRVRDFYSHYMFGVIVQLCV